MFDAIRYDLSLGTFLKYTKILDGAVRAGNSRLIESISLKAMESGRRALEFSGSATNPRDVSRKLIETLGYIDTIRNNNYQTMFWRQGFRRLTRGYRFAA